MSSNEGISDVKYTHTAREWGGLLFAHAHSIKFSDSPEVPKFLKNDVRKTARIPSWLTWKHASYVIIRSVLNSYKKYEEKDKVHPRTGHEGLEAEYRYSSTLSLTSTLYVGRWLTPRPGRFTPGKRPSTHRIGGWVGLRACLNECVNPPLPGFDPRTFQPIAPYNYKHLKPDHVQQVFYSFYCNLHYNLETYFGITFHPTFRWQLNFHGVYYDHRPLGMDPFREKQREWEGCFPTPSN
jgi:hypothetical protein